MNKKIMLASLTAAALISGTAFAQQMAPSITAGPAVNIQAAEAANAANAAIAAAGVSTVMSATELQQLGKTLNADARAKRTVNKLTGNLIKLAKLKRTEMIGEVDASALMNLNSQMIVAIRTVDDEDRTKLLELLNGQLGRAMDSVSGNASDLEKQNVIEKLNNASQDVTDLDASIGRVFNVTVEQMAKACAL